MFNNKPHGFTLIELLLTTVIAAVLLLVAVPMTRQFIAESRSITVVDHITGALNFARSEAIKQGVPVIFCPSSDQTTCSGDWSQGQIVTTGQRVLRHLPKLSIGARLTWAANLGQNKGIEFLPSGFTKGQNGSFHYCPVVGSTNGRAIIINSAGRIRVNKTGTVDSPLRC